MLDAIAACPKETAVPMFRGLPACPCQVVWIPVYEAELLRRHVIKHNVDIFQLIGGAVASGGTHATGGAGDYGQTQRVAIRVARQMGADATWHRPPNWDGKGGIEHTHSVLRGCPHNGPARYQIDAVDAGFNGLGHLGRGAKDDGPRPLSGRTWEEGIAWAQDRQGILEFATWNLRQGRRPVTRVVAEVLEFLDEHDIDVMTVSEANDYVDALAPALRSRGYQLVAFRGRDGSARDSAVIVRMTLRRARRRLWRLESQGWERKPGRLGLHWPRSAVSVRVHGTAVLATHQAPGPFGKRFPLRKAANEAGFAAVTRIGRRWTKRGTPWVMPGDWNRTTDDPIAKAFLTATGATAFGDGIDWAAGHGVQITNMREVEFGTSDHQPKVFTVTKGTVR